MLEYKGERVTLQLVPLTLLLDSSSTLSLWCLCTEERTTEGILLWFFTASIRTSCMFWRSLLWDHGLDSQVRLFMSLLSTNSIICASPQFQLWPLLSSTGSSQRKTSSRKEMKSCTKSGSRTADSALSTLPSGPCTPSTKPYLSLFCALLVSSSPQCMMERWVVFGTVEILPTLHASLWQT